MSLALDLPRRSSRGFRKLGFAGELLIAILGGATIGVSGAFALADAEQQPAQVEEVHTEPIRATPEALAKPMKFTLTGDGVLIAQGSIEPGTAAKFEAKLQALGESVKAVSLNSPGGSLNEAMSMARQVRAHSLATEVADGAICASSCPLLFAGGVERTAGSRAAIAVHQFYTRPVPGLRGSIDAMSDAQLTTARVSRHLLEMGIDPAAWLHALDTPPTSLYYFSTWELAEYHFTTGRQAPSDDGVFGALAHFLETI
ncbi:MULTISPECIES: hypothetical protein [Mesorhizobium]|uniref:Uncharacterized protein n=1 Tax=Mesorhizobium denitrificans TaxID=2294114 RepID=A0A371XGM5_9HYPH|nr:MULTISPECIES: hypothetical protein [Mesorhizobium]RFC68371.1 hypothetical protein DY251_05165 [Mesorhizobium denitrificans]